MLFLAPNQQCQRHNNGHKTGRINLQTNCRVHVNDWVLHWRRRAAVKYRTTFTSMLFFTARCYASAVLAMALCPSVTSRSSTKTAKRRITQTTPHDSQGTLVFWSQRSPRNSTGVTSYGGAKCRWGGSKSSIFDK